MAVSSAGMQSVLYAGGFRHSEGWDWRNEGWDWHKKVGTGTAKVRTGTAKVGIEGHGVHDIHLIHIKARLCVVGILWGFTWSGRVPFGGAYWRLFCGGISACSYIRHSPNYC